MAKAKLSQMKKETEERIEKNVKKEIPLKKEKEKKSPLESNIPRGERSNFLKTTITIPADLLSELRALGMRRKAAKMKDTDTSALIREALVDFLNKHKSD